MSIIDGTFDFQLTTPIEYAFGGQVRQGTFVTFYEPAGVHSGPALRLLSYAHAAMKKMLEYAASRADFREQIEAHKVAIELKKPHEIEEKSVSTDLGRMYLNADKFDIEGFLACFDKLMTMNHKKVAAKINNEQPFTAGLLEEVSPKDHLNMAAAYANFMMERL